jgi:hypothetical protein
MRFRSWMLLGFALSLGCCRIASAQEQPTLLGVLEDTPGHHFGDPHYRSVRVVFRKQGEDWKAFPSNGRNQRRDPPRSLPSLNIPLLSMRMSKTAQTPVRNPDYPKKSLKIKKGALWPHISRAIGNTSPSKPVKNMIPKSSWI